MPRRTLVTLSSLYVTQFLGIGFLFTALIAILRDRGASLEQLGAVYLFTLAWVVKLLWAPAVDRFGLRRVGHYRSWLIVLQPSTALAIAALIPLDVVADLPFVLVALAVVALLSATQDIATDALAVRLVHGQNRGTINGVQIGAGFVGDILGGGLVLVVYGRAGWAAAIGTLVVLTLLPLIAVARFREPVWEQGPTREHVTFSAVVTVLGRPGVARWALLIVPLSVLGMAGAYAMLVPMLIDAGWSPALVGIVTNSAGGAVSIVAALVGGWLVPRLGRRRTLLLYCLAEAVVIAGLLPVAAGAAPVAPTVVTVVLFTGVNAATWAAIYTVNMDYSRDRTAGTDFTVQVAIFYLARLAAGSGVTALAGTFGYMTMMVVCIALSLLGAVAVWRLFVGPAAAADHTAAPRPEVAAVD